MVGGDEGRHPACGQPRAERFRLRLGHGQTGQTGCAVGFRGVVRLKTAEVSGGRVRAGKRMRPRFVKKFNFLFA